MDILGLLAQMFYFVVDITALRLLFFVKIYSLVRYDRSIEAELSVNSKYLKAYSIVKAVLIYYLFANTASCIFYYIDYALYLQ